MDRSKILIWLKQEDESKLEWLWDLSDVTRKKNVGDEIHLRGLIEISNHCIFQCTYCGIRSGNKKISRYRMTEEEIMASVFEIEDLGLGTVVFQSGEDYGIETEFLAKIVSRIKSETDLAIALSMGERTTEDLTAWKKAGADRYLLKFETSNQDLYHAIHPDLPGRVSDRFAILNTLRDLGYEVGSGIMIGIPGQSYESVADDLILFKKLDLDMIAVGPFIPHPDTPLGRGKRINIILGDNQVPSTELMTKKVLALSRIMCPEANIPSTTALSVINEKGREIGFTSGANVVMPNFTPEEYRLKYDIYPGKSSNIVTNRDNIDQVISEIRGLGRGIGKGQGERRRS